MNYLEYDFVVVGSGLAGLMAAYHASKFGSVAILTKAGLDVSNSYHAQGGIAAALLSDDSPQLHLQDTLEAGRGLCDVDAVEVLVTEGRDRVLELIEMGMQFDKENGEYVYGLEGGHSHRRILHSGGDATGREMTRFMVEKVEALQNVTPFEHTKAIELLIENNTCRGVKAINFQTMETLAFSTNATILATGGLSRLFHRSTNPYTATGDGIALVWDAGVRLADMEFIQFHPSALMVQGHDAFLLSEAIRGEGAWLLDQNHNRFMLDLHPLAELAPRDVVASAIYNQMKKDGTNHVFLSLRHLDADYIKARFSTIYNEVLKMGLNLTSDLIPIAPAAHYMVGGVRTGLNGDTNLPGLWACGEVASTGVMGANRLASNSLLECLVYSKRAVYDALKVVGTPMVRIECESVNYQADNAETFLHYRNIISDIMTDYVSLVRNEEGLKKAMNQLKFIHETFRNKGDEYNLDKINNIANISFLIARAALLREESRGGHKRDDFPETSAEFEKHIIQQRNIEPYFESVRK